MIKHTKTAPVQTVGLLAVIMSLVAVMAVMTHAEGDTSRSLVSYAGASANPYQPILPYQPSAYTPSERSIQVSSSRARVLPKAVLQRKIKQLARTITSVHKRLMMTEDKIDVLERTISTVSGNTSELTDSLVRLTASRLKLSNQLAKLESDRANLTLQLADAQ